MRKICPHIERGTSQALGSPPVVKLLNVDAAYVRQVRGEVGPDTLLDVRWTQPNEYQPLDDPERRAREFFERYLPDMIAMTDEGRDTNIVFESPYNEIGDEQAEAHARFLVEWLVCMHVVGLRSAMGNWSVGCPDLPVWAIYQKALDAMHSGDVASLHEYWADEQDLRDPGHWHAGRFGLVPELAQVPIIITECSRDYIPDTGKGKPGWKKTCNAEQMFYEMELYDDLLCKYPNVIGAAWYTMGQHDSQWDAFDASELWPRVVAEQEPWVQQMEAVVRPMTAYRISQRFGENQEYYSQWGIDGHNGVDLAVPDPEHVRDWHGTPIQSVSDGRAVIGRSDGYGLYVYVYGPDADWLYAHLSEIVIRDGQQIEAGQMVGCVGYSGNTEPPGVLGTHLHWGKRPKPYPWGNGYNGYIDPLT